MQRRHAVKAVNYIKTRTRWCEYAPVRTRQAIKVIWALHAQREWTVYDVIRIIGCTRTLARRIIDVLVRSRTAYVVETGGGRRKTTRYAWTIDRIIEQDMQETITQETSDSLPNQTDTPTHVISNGRIQSEENKLSRSQKIKRGRKSSDVLTAIRSNPALAKEPLKPHYPFWRDILRRMRCGLGQHHVPAHIVRAATGMLARMLLTLKPTVGRAVEIATEIYRALCAQARLTVQRVRWIIGNVVRRIVRGKSARPRKQVERYYIKHGTHNVQRTQSAPPQREELPRERRSTGGTNAIADLVARIFGGAVATHETTPLQRKMTTQQVIEWYQRFNKQNEART